MSGYEALLSKVRDFIKERGRVHLDELLEWASENEVGPITLSMIVNDLIASGEVKGEGSTKELEEPLALPVPEILVYKSALKTGATKEVTLLETKPEKPKTKTKTKPSIIEFSPLFSSIAEEVTEKPKEAPSHEQPAKPEEASGVPLQIELVPEERTTPQEPHRVEPEAVEEEELPPEIADLDEDMRKAIEYLNEFHSVGELRFLLDLESLGVKNPKEVLYKLIDLGYVVRLPLGVIDATDRLPKIRKKRSSSLASFI